MNVRVRGNLDKVIYKCKGDDGHVWKLMLHSGADGVKVFYWMSQGKIYIISLEEIRQWYSEDEYMMDEKEKENILYYINGGE
ncbi:hypothetical protein [Metallosphaera sp.]|uniref:hypothetical protein n=1 Tax=Metallosphaera sp. TaxID=2020860 RepID=UPI00316DFE4F